jgi:hypothetical protein
LSTDPEECAAFTCDRHVGKMIVESCQLLSMAMKELTGDSPYGFSPSHLKHPCGIWVRQSLGNYQWLWRLTTELGKEFARRYGKLHRSHGVLLTRIPYVLPFKRKRMTPFANVTPYKNEPDVVTAYRLFYIHDKPFACWKDGRVPPWWVTPGRPTETRPAARVRRQSKNWRTAPRR